MQVKTRIWEQCSHMLAGKARRKWQIDSILPIYRGQLLEEPTAINPRTIQYTQRGSYSVKGRVVSPSKQHLSAFYDTPPSRNPCPTEALTRRLLRTLLRSESCREPSKNPSKKRVVAWPPLVHKSHDNRDLGCPLFGTLPTVHRSHRISANKGWANKGLPLPLGRGVCKTKSKNGCSRPRKPFISRVFCEQRGIETMGSDHGLGRGQIIG